MAKHKVAELHVHSVYSDGEFTPGEIIDKAKEKGTRYLAITDHNSVGGVDEALEKGREKGVEIIPAVEISAQGNDILGYFIDYSNERLLRVLEKCAGYSNKNVKSIIRELRKQGIEVTYQDMREKFPHPEDNYNKHHLAEWLMKEEDLDVKECFDLMNYLESKEFEKNNPTIIEAIELVKDFGGVPVLAHPWIEKSLLKEEKFRELIEAGLEGIEFENGDVDRCGRPEVVGRMKELADKYDLVLTQGSDYHGNKLVKLTGRHRLAEYNCSEQVVEELKKLSDNI